MQEVVNVFALGYHTGMSKKEDGFVFNQKAIKYLADIVNTTQLTEVEYSCGDIKIKLAKQQHIVQQAVPAPVMMSSTCAPSVSDAAVPVAPIAEESGVVVTAPVVGKIYVAAKPGDKPFISVGDSVKEGDVIFIIEAMKVMNNVKATKSGVVKEILVQDGMPVEFGQNLVRLG